MSFVHGRCLKITGLLIHRQMCINGEVFKLYGRQMQLGRNGNSDIHVANPSVSRLHCTFQYSDEDGWSVMDNKSQNGTYLNEQPLIPSVPAKLKHGDTIYLGDPVELPDAFIFQEMRTKDDHFMVFPRNTAGVLDVEIENWISNLENENREKENVLIHKQSQNHKDEKEISNETPSNSRGKKRNLDNYDSTYSKKLRSSSMHFQASCSKDFDKNIHMDTSARKDGVHDNIESAHNPEENKNEMCILSNLKTFNVNTPAKNVNICSSDVISSQPKCSSRKNKRKKKKTANRQIIEQAKVEVVVAAVENSQNHNQTAPDEEEDNSQSLLSMEGVAHFTLDSYPFSQPLDSPTPKPDALDNNTPLIINVSTAEKVAADVQSQESIIAMLQKKISSLQIENEALEKSKAELSKALKEKKDVIDKQLDKENKLMENMKKCEQVVKEEFSSDLVKKLEEELLCNVCTEILIKATVLDCSHTFCEYCITEWRKKKNQCPICRNKIQSETKVLLLDQFVDKALDILNPEYKEKRKDVLKQREAAQTKQKETARKSAPRRRGRRPNNARSSTVTPVTAMEPAEEEHYDDAMMFIDELRSRYGLDDYLNFALSSGMTSDTGSDTSVEGNGYYGGHGRCFNCGRRGHWANGCPDL